MAKSASFTFFQVLPKEHLCAGHRIGDGPTGIDLKWTLYYDAGEYVPSVGQGIVVSSATRNKSQDTSIERP